MKIRKFVSGAAAAAMALAAMPLSALAVTAATYSLGDVDMDGVITGHDSAMVSRYLYEDSYTLTEREKLLADIDGNGVVDQSDLEAIHAQETFVLGDVMMQGGAYPHQADARNVLVYWTSQVAGSVSASDLTAIEKVVWGYNQPISTFSDMDSPCSSTLEFNEVQYNLADSNADGVVDCVDAYNILTVNAWASLTFGERLYTVDGRYDYCYVDELDSTQLGSYTNSHNMQGDVDEDGVITGHDSALVSRALYEDDFELSIRQVILADMNCDGVVDQSDLEAIHAREVYTIGDVNMDGGTYGNQIDAYYTLMFASYQSVGVPISVEKDANDKAFFSASDKRFKSILVDEVRYNLMDVNADGRVDCYDAYYILCANGMSSIGDSYYGVQGRYDLQGM